MVHEVAIELRAIRRILFLEETAFIFFMTELKKQMCEELPTVKQSNYRPGQALRVPGSW